MHQNTFRRLAIAAVLFWAAASVHAQVYTEIGDAGQTPGTAQNTGITQPNIIGTTSMIFGSISGINDADVFSLTLNSPSTVQFSTINALTSASGGAGGLDTELFLFKSNGAPIYCNDDATGATVQSRLPANTPFTMSLSAGTYLIGISLSGNEPVNSNNQLVFATNSDPKAVRGPALGINPGVFSNFDSFASFAQSGNYEIDITTVPEPSSILLSLAGGVFFAGWVRKRRAARTNI